MYLMLTDVSQFSMSTSKSPTLQTDVSFTGMNFNISQSTTLKIEVTSNEENNINQSTTLRAEISSTDQYFNISQILTTTAFSNEKDFNIQSSKHLITYTKVVREVRGQSDFGKITVFMALFATNCIVYLDILRQLISYMYIENNV